VHCGTENFLCAGRNDVHGWLNCKPGCIWDGGHNCWTVVP
jgi:hypothetical protein